MYKDTLKQIASYVWDIPIERTTSPQNDYLEVVWSNGRKMLNTKEANFSFGNGYKVFETAMKQVEPQIPLAKNIAILGFGCGSIHHLLEKKYKYTGSLIGIEYDAEILRLYTDHFADQYNLKPELHVEDAFKYAKSTNQTFDIVFIDLFYELQNSPLLDSEEFLSSLQRMCKNGGTLIFNTTTTDEMGLNTVFELQMWLSKHYKNVIKTPFQDFNQILIAR